MHFNKKTKFHEHNYIDEKTQNLNLMKANFFIKFV